MLYSLRHHGYIPDMAHTYLLQVVARYPFETDISQSKTDISQSGIPPLRNWLFTPELQWQSRGYTAYLTGDMALTCLRVHMAQCGPPYAFV